MMLKNEIQKQSETRPVQPLDAPHLLVLDRDTGDLVEYVPVRRVTPKSEQSAEAAMKLARSIKWIVCRMGLRG